MYKIFILIVITTIVFIKFRADGQENGIVSFTYTGSKVCRECHGEDAIGNQYKIWSMSPHSKAYSTLLGEKASEIAKRNNITSPEKNLKCLQCHATGKGKVESIVIEGVGCESCHGPGSEYHKASNHVDYSGRENGYRRAIRFGMYPIRGIESLKRRERLCLSCHTKDRPCFPDNPSNIYEFKIPIQTIDSLWKGDVNFRHPLRK